MKFLLITLLMANIQILKADESFVEILNNKEKEQVIRLIDDACKDFLCAKQYDFQFKKFDCDENAFMCKLRFQILDRGFIPGKFSHKKATCLFMGVSKAEQIILDNKLNDDFFEELDGCINKIIKE